MSSFAKEKKIASESDPGMNPGCNLSLQENA